jgi:putative sterol carrier protein
MPAPDAIGQAPRPAPRHEPFSQPWADALRAVVEGDADYRRAAAGWTLPLAMVLEPTPALGIPEGRAVELALERGRCHDARAIAPSAVTADLVLAGAYPAWKAIVRGALDPVTAVTTGRLTLARGSLVTLMTQMGAARALVACARRVPTRFPDEEDGGPA